MSSYINTILSKISDLACTKVNLVQDGKTHRFPTKDKPAHKNGWYISGEYCTKIGDFASGYEELIKISELDSEYNFISAEKIKEKQEIARLLEIEELKEKKIHCDELWNKNYNEDILQETCDYLIKKKIGLYNAKIANNTLIVPIYDIEDLKICGIQYITCEKKRFLLGSKKKTHFGCVGFMPEDIKDIKEFYMAEGYATAYSIYEATNKPVIIAIDCGNIIDCCRIFSNLGKNIIICADKDKTGTGEKKAREANNLFPLNTSVLVAEPKEGKDFNDILCFEGIDILKKQLRIESEDIVEKKEEELKINKETNIFEELEYLIHNKDFENSINPYSQWTDPKLPKILLQPPKVIKEVLEWVIDQSVFPQPLLTITHIITTLGCLLGHRLRYTTTGDVRTNVYAIGISKSGTGKDASRQALEKILIDLGLQKMMSSGMKSDSAIFKKLKKSDGRLNIIIDEIGGFLKALKNSTTSWEIKIIERLKQFYTQSSSQSTSEDKASDDEEEITINQPCVSVFGMTTREKLIENISVESATDGFLGRFIMVDGFYHRIPNLKRKYDVDEIPSNIIDIFRSINEMSTNCTLRSSNDIEIVVGSNQQKIKPQIIEVGEEEKVILFDYLDYINQKSMKLQELKSKDADNLTALLNRSFVKVVQIATICSFDHNLKKQVMTKEAIRYAIALVSYSDTYMLELISKYLFSSLYEKNYKMILNMVKEDNGINTQSLVRKIGGGMRTRDIEEILLALLKAGIINKDKNSFFFVDS